MIKLKKYAVIGNPIAHSISPIIHTAFAKQFDINLQYDRIQVTSPQFNDQVHRFFKEGQGLNVTAPLKHQAAHFVEDRVTERARLADAANTLWIHKEDHLIWGDNTDGIGLVRDITHHFKINMRDKKIMILGAGGAVFGILHALLETKPQTVDIYNRTIRNADKLVNTFKSYGPVTNQSHRTKIEQPYDIVIQATSAGFQGTMPSIPTGSLGKKTELFYDMVYGDNAKHCLKYAQHHQVRCITDGLGMLVEQAAESFSIWHGIRPNTQIVLDMLRKP